MPRVKQDVKVANRMDRIRKRGLSVYIEPLTETFDGDNGMDADTVLERLRDGASIAQLDAERMASLRDLRPGTPEHKRFVEEYLAVVELLRVKIAQDMQKREIGKVEPMSKRFAGGNAEAWDNVEQ